jgi:SAM-dependent methyltransferase
MENHSHPVADLDPAAMAELLDLDGEVLHGLVTDIVSWAGGLAAGRAPRRIVDLGTGTGTWALALAERFTESEVIAVDQSGPMLGRLTDKARALGVADRVRAIEADLDAGWPGPGAVDLVWASASLHHLADPVRLLAEVYGALRPGGLAVVVELDAFPRFLPDDVGLGQPGLEARCAAAARAVVDHELPHFGADWGPRLSQAWFAVEAERDFAVELTSPLPAAAGRYAQASLRRLRSGLDGRLSADDLAVLDVLTGSDGPDGLLRRGDLTVRAARSVWVGRRAGVSLG